MTDERRPFQPLDLESRAHPIGVELAVAQHLEDLLSSDDGRALLIEIADRDIFSGPSESAKARRELAAFLASKLVSRTA